MVNLIRRDPFTSIFAWPRWLDDFDQTFPTLTTQKGLRIHETDKNIVIEAVVAGVPAADVEIHIDGGVITIKAEKSEEKKAKDEFSASHYQYYYTAALSGGQWNKASAEIEDGVVKVSIPKTEAAKPRKITVKAKSAK